MKNRVIKVISKLFIVIVLAITLTGTIDAQYTRNEGVGHIRSLVIKLIDNHNKSKLRDNDLVINKITNSNKFNVLVADQTNFNLGSKFVTALMGAAYFGKDENAAKTTIVDIVYLIDSLEGQPETVGLQKTLKAVVRGTATAAQFQLEIENAAKSYSSRLTRDQKWYFNSGTAVTNLVFSAYTGDDAVMKKSLSEIKELIKIAPQGTSSEIIISMNNLAKYVGSPTFAENDYTAIFAGALGLVETINA